MPNRPRNAACTPTTHIISDVCSCRQPRVWLPSSKTTPPCASPSNAICARAAILCSFASAEEFLQSRLADSAFGLVLDINLRGMSGIDLARRLLAAGTRLPVVFITAFDDAATRTEADALGCVDFLQKPFEASRLIGALERAESRDRRLRKDTRPLVRTRTKGQCVRTAAERTLRSSKRSTKGTSHA